MADIYERMYDASVRIEEAWPFPVNQAPERLGEALDERSNDLPAEIAQLIENWPEEEREELFSGHGWRFQDAYDELCATAVRKGVAGWIGIAATPVFTPHDEGNGASFSWGHYYTKLLFSENADGLLEASVAWAEKRYSDAMTERKKRNG